MLVILHDLFVLNYITQYVQTSRSFSKTNVETIKMTYRPVSILSVVLKIFEKKYEHTFFDLFLRQCLKISLWFPKRFQKSKPSPFDAWKMKKHAFDNGNNSGALLTDLSKACNGICRDFRFPSLSALKLAHNYLQNRTKTKNGNSP